MDLFISLALARLSFDADAWLALSSLIVYSFFFFFFQAEDGIRDSSVTGVQTCALPISEALRLAGDPSALCDHQWRRSAERSASDGERLVLLSRSRLRTHHAVVGDQIGRASCRERV